MKTRERPFNLARDGCEPLRVSAQNSVLTEATQVVEPPMGKGDHSGLQLTFERGCYEVRLPEESNLSQNVR